MRPILNARWLTGKRGSFEGVVVMRGGRDMDGRTMTYYLRNGLMRVEMTAGEGEEGMTMIADPAQGKSYILMPPQKTYMEFDVGAAIGEALGEKPPQITKTGRMETIAGHRCEHWIVQDDDSRSEMCVAKGFGSLMGPPGSGVREPAWYRELRREGFFPLRVSEGGEMMMEVTGIERKTLDPALFRVPSDYRKFDMPGAGGIPKRP
ncbi:MAG: DUF4412 domain-containing protein [Gemmatimonadaceae bacterium]